MYKVVDCDENCIMTIVDTSGNDGRKYYADMNTGDIVGVDDNGKQFYPTVRDNKWDKIKFAANMYQVIDNDRVYHSVYDLYVLDFINHMRWNLHLDNIHEVIKIFSPYFNLIESFSKILSNIGLDDTSKMFSMDDIYYGIQNLYDSEQNLEILLPRYIQDVIYIYNNKKYIEPFRNIRFYTRGWREVHAVKVLIQKIKQMQGIDIYNDSYKIRIIVCLEIIYNYIDKYIELCINIMKSKYIDELYYDSIQIYKMLAKYIDGCEEKGTTPRVSEKIIKDLYNNKIKKEMNKKEKLVKGIAASAVKYKWIEEFEYAGYAAYVMKSLDDFMEEANHQNNCVARCGYDERMAKGEIVICRLRKDDDWITCEIDDGKIEQMFGKNNSDVDEDIKETFQEFLNDRF